MRKKLIEEKLNSRKSHVREVGDFSCGAQTESLDEYIKGNAFNEIKEYKEKVYLVKDEKNNIVGYYSLKSSAINYIISGRNNVKPFVELSEFAIDINFQRKGYGTAIMLGYVFEKIKQISDIIGCQGIITFALNKEAIKFYESLGYQKVDKEVVEVWIDNYVEGCTPMLISIDTIMSIYSKKNKKA